MTAYDEASIPEALRALLAAERTGVRGALASYGAACEHAWYARVLLVELDILEERWRRAVACPLRYQVITPDAPPPVQSWPPAIEARLLEEARAVGGLERLRTALVGWRRMVSGSAARQIVHDAMADTVAWLEADRRET